MRVLCVEDEPALREDIVEYLRMKSYDVDEASSGIEAILKLKRQQYDLVLCDIKMPEMDGHELLRQMRGEDRLMAMPFLFLSALNERDDKVRAHANGCDAYLTKPIDFSVLDATVRSHIERQQLRNVLSDSKIQASQRHMMSAIDDALTGPLLDTGIIIQHLRETVPVLTPSTLDEYLANLETKLNAHMIDLHTFHHTLQLQSAENDLRHDAILAEDLILSAMEEARYHCPSMPVQYKATKSEGIMVHGDKRMLQRALAGLLAEVPDAYGTKDIVRYTADAAQATITIADDPAMLAEENFIPISAATNLANLSTATRQRLAALTYAVQVAKAHQGQLEILVWSEDKLAVRVMLPQQKQA